MEGARRLLEGSLAKQGGACALLEHQEEVGFPPLPQKPLEGFSQGRAMMIGVLEISLGVSIKGRKETNAWL